MCKVWRLEKFVVIDNNRVKKLNSILIMHKESSQNHSKGLGNHKIWFGAIRIVCVAPKVSEISRLASHLSARA